MASQPPPDVADAAARVEAWLAQQQAAQGRVTEDQFAKMSAADRIEYTRKFDQSHFQPKAGPARR